jgi:hypothetical protein
MDETQKQTKIDTQIFPWKQAKKLVYKPEDGDSIP